jgi:ketosteroid isomerase-like protein
VPLTPEDEGLHAAADDPDWQESVYLAWRDAGSGLGGNHRIGNEAGRGTANLWCGVYHQDGTRFRWNGEELELHRLEKHGLTAGPQRLFHDGDRLRFVLDGEGCAVDLEIEDAPGSLVMATAEAFSGSGTIFSNNYHVFCTVRGTATLDGRTVTVEAPAWRDHSWGVRRWDSFVASRSCAGSFGSSVQFRYGSMVGANGRFFRYGALIRDGSPVEVVGTEMLVEVDDDGIRCPAADVRFHLAGGGLTTVRIETIGGMMGVTRQRFGWESVGDVSIDGEPGGWGFLEVNNNPRNGHDPPVFVLADGLTNGVVRPAS